MYLRNQRSKEAMEVYRAKASARHLRIRALKKYVEIFAVVAGWREPEYDEQEDREQKKAQQQHGECLIGIHRS